MSELIVLVENPNDWKDDLPKLPVVNARDYLAQTQHAERRDLHIINLCRSYRYLSIGYYCSLLAEARDQRVIPTVRTLQDLSRKSIYTLDAEALERLLRKALKRQARPDQTEFEIDLFFGQGAAKELMDVARQIFETFRMPLLKLVLKRQTEWRLDSIRPLHLHNLDEEGREEFSAGLHYYLSRRWRRPAARARYRYDLAVLCNPSDPLPPSDAAALSRFIRAGKERGVNVELITRKDYPRLAEYDALFIRETTSLNHYTYQFAKKAESEGMVVIDDPESIVKCTNKVYLAELLRAHNVPRPQQVIVSKANLGDIEQTIPYPIVLKIPDGSFSRGVFKVSNDAELHQVARKLLKESDLILAQEFVYTEFDWRVGILGGEPLFVCQYFMSKQHWQIVNHAVHGRPEMGMAKTFAISEAPRKVVKTALKAANLIGDGLYGVDIKEHERGLFVIEVNDNPNIDVGVEDLVLKDQLYLRVIDELARRLDRLRAR